MLKKILSVFDRDAKEKRRERKRIEEELEDVRSKLETEREAFREEIRRLEERMAAVREKVEADRANLLELEFPHIRDLAPEPEEETRSRVLQPTDFEAFAEKYDLEVPVVQAVVSVESGGSGFLTDGRPKILFEGHVFWRQLKKRGIDPEAHVGEHPTILYPTWQRKHYKGGAGEYDRLEEAKRIDAGAALASASWGLFQIMGYHAESLGYEDVFEYVDKMNESEAEHLDAFGRFLERDGLLGFLREKEWASFARRYNGPRYAENRYHEKLATSYAAHKVEDGGIHVA